MIFISVHLAHKYMNKRVKLQHNEGNLVVLPSEQFSYVHENIHFV